MLFSQYKLLHFYTIVSFPHYIVPACRQCPQTRIISIKPNRFLIFSQTLKIHLEVRFHIGPPEINTSINLGGGHNIRNRTPVSLKREVPDSA